MAQNEQINAIQDTALIVDAAHGVLANDPGATLVLPLVQLLRTSAGGQIYFDTDGSYKYISAPGFSGTDTVQYTTDNAGAGTLTINVAATALVPFVSVGDQLGARHQVTHGFGQVGDGVATSDFTQVALAGGGYVVAVDYLDQAFGTVIKLQTYDANHNLVSVFDPGVVGGGLRIAALPNGGYAVAYGVRDQNAGTQTISVQLFDAAGHSLTGPTPYDVPGPLDGLSGLSVLPNGGFVLLVSTVDTFYAQSFSAAGVPESQQYAIGVAGQSRVAGILPDGDIVTYHVDSGNDLHLQRYDVHGNPLGGDIHPVGAAGNIQNTVHVAQLAGGGFAIAWASNTTVPDPDPNVRPHQFVQLYTQAVDANGNLVGTANERDFGFTSIFGAPNENITPLANGGYVVWGRSTIDNGQSVDIVQAYDANGNPVGDRIEFVSITAFGVTRALAYALPDGGFAVGLQSADPASHNLLIYDNNGNSVGEVRMHDPADGTGSSSFVLANRPDGDTLVVGQSFSSTDLGSNDIWAQTIRFDTATPVIQANQTGGTAKFSAAILPVNVYIPDPDGSEIVQSIEISGVPVGWTLSYPHATATLNAGVWTVTGPGIANGGAIDLHLTAPSGTTGSGTLSVIAHTIDTDNGSQNQSFPASFDFAHLPVNNPAPFDFNGDGRGDFFWTTNGGALAVWGMDGFQISAPDYVRLGASAVGLPGPDWHVVDTRDVDGDNNTDVLWRTDGGNLAVWLMDGNHIIGADYLRIGSTAINTPAKDWHPLGLLDANGDGNGDILWRTDSGALAIWQLDGNQITSADYLHSGSSLVGVPAPDWHIVGAGDFDGDGKAGLLWRTDGGALATWELDGNQIKSAAYTKLGASIVGAPGPDWHVVAIADFDGDGKSDILWRIGPSSPMSGLEPGGGSIAIWLMDGNQIKAADYTRLGSTIVGAPGADWHILGADDRNGDGKADLLWQTDSGALAIWEMDGTHITAADYTRIGSTAIGTPAPDWHVYEHRWDVV
jgi:hypothetical protein